jgi:DNA-binding NtrC family response regulator
MLELSRKIVEYVIPPPVELSEPATGLRPVRILLVEDDPTQQETMVSLLRQRGTVILVASSVSEALGHIESVDLLVLDIVIGGNRGAGDTLFRRWQAVNPGMPCLVMSAYLTEEKRLELLRDGATNALSKPVGLDVITRLVGNYIYQVQTQEQIKVLETNYSALRSALISSDKLRLQQQRTFLAVLVFVLLSLVLPNTDKIGAILDGILKILQ